jgi:hypothetical protein
MLNDDMTTTNESPALHADELDRLSRIREGDLAEVSFAMLLYALNRAHTSATLRIERGPLWKEISFEGGVPVDCRSNLIQETLSRFIVSIGRLEQITAESCYRESITRSVRFGDVLIEKELMGAEELLNILQQNLAHKLLDGFSWQSGSFHVDGRPPQVDSPLKVNVPQLVFIGVNRFATQEVIDSLIAPLIGKQLALNPNPVCGIDQLKINTKHEGVVSALQSGGVRIDQLAALDGVAYEELTRLLYALTLIEVVVPADGLSVEAPPPVEEGPDSPPSKQEEQAIEVSEERRAQIMELALNHRRKGAAELLEVPMDANLDEVGRRFFEFARDYAPWQYEEPLRERAGQVFLAGARAYADLYRQRSTGASSSEARPLESLSKTGVSPAAVQKSDDDPHDETNFRITSDLLDPEVQFERGLQLVKAGEYTQALEQFDFAAELDPQNLRYASERAYCQHLCDPSKSAQSSLEALREVLRVDPTFGLALYYVGEILRKANRLDEAASFLRRSLKPMAPDRRPVDALRKLSKARKEAEA